MIFQLYGNIFDQNRKIILSFIIEIKHSVYIVLVPPESNKKDNRCTNHHTIQNIHNIVIVTVIRARKFNRWKFYKPRIPTHPLIHLAIIPRKEARVNGVKTSKRKQNGEIDDSSFDKCEKHRCARIQYEKLNFTIRKNLRSCRYSYGKLDCVEWQQTARTDRDFILLLERRIVPKGRCSLVDFCILVIGRTTVHFL